jgi:hypothetical protein
MEKMLVLQSGYVGEFSNGTARELNYGILVTWLLLLYAQGPQLLLFFLAISESEHKHLI